MSAISMQRVRPCLEVRMRVHARGRQRDQSDEHLYSVKPQPAPLLRHCVSGHKCLHDEDEEENPLLPLPIRAIVLLRVTCDAKVYKGKCVYIYIHGLVHAGGIDYR